MNAFSSSLLIVILQKVACTVWFRGTKPAHSLAHATVVALYCSHSRPCHGCCVAHHLQIWSEDIYGVDNNLISHVTFENCFAAFNITAPSSQREPASRVCKAPFDNPAMNYMDKTVFYRNRVLGQEGQVGFVLDPCRGDGLNMW
jgi:hypothetical protein